MAFDVEENARALAALGGAPVSTPPPLASVAPPLVDMPPPMVDVGPPAPMASVEPPMMSAAPPVAELPVPPMTPPAPAAVAGPPPAPVPRGVYGVPESIMREPEPAAAVPSALARPPTPTPARAPAGGGGGGGGPSARDQYAEKAYGGQLGAMRAMGAADRAEAITKSEGLEARAQELEAEGVRQAARAQETQAREAQRQLAVDVQMDRIRKATDEAANAHAEGTFLERNPGAPLVALGSVFGAILAAKMGRPDDGQALLTQMIEHDAQKERDIVARKERGVQAQRTVLGDMMNQFGSQREAEQAAEIARRQIVDRRLATIDTRNMSEVERAGVAKLQAANQLEIEKLTTAARKEYDAKASAAAAASAAARRQAIDDALKLEGVKNERRKLDIEERRSNAAASKDEAEAASKMPQDVGAGVALRPEDRGRYVPGYGLALTDTDGKEIRAQSAAVTSLNDIAQRALEVRRSPKAFIPGTTENSELKALQGRATMMVKNSEQLGALSGSDLELAQRVTGDLTSIRPGTDAAIAAGANSTMKSFRTAIQKRGVQPIAGAAPVPPPSMRREP